MMSSATTSNEYWLSKAGTEYREQQELRGSSGNAQYATQEQWLLAYFKNKSEQLGRPIRVLDFGCGFGRIARLLAGLEHVDYYGYDFSEAMARELLDSPPAGLVPIDERVKIAPTVLEAYGGEQFDVVFTVSVLIHNPPAQARVLVNEMASLLNDSGALLFVENALSALSMRENSWHAGCWIHDVPGTLARGFSVDVYPEVMPYHAIYEVTRAAEGGRSLTWHDRDGNARPVTLDELKIAGLPRLEMGVASMEGELEGGAATLGTLHDEREFNQRRLQDLVEKHEREVASLEAVASECEYLRQNQARMEEQLHFRNQIREVLGIARAGIAEVTSAMASPIAAQPVHEPASVDSRFVLDAPQDLQFANADARFAGTAQVFHQEWFGIRAACGALPGSKLGISAQRPLSAAEIDSLVAALRARSISKLVMHGMSESMFALAKVLVRAGFELHVVWHGAAVMWLWESERRYFEMALSLLASGTVKSVHPIRRGMDVLLGDKGVYRKQLLNAVPNARIERPGARRSEGAIAFSPSWNLLHKNVATNIAGAAVSPRVAEIWTMAPDAVAVVGKQKPLKRLPVQSQSRIMKTMAAADIVLNVSLVDCHPMVDLEALAARTPCLRGMLFLDVLEDHPYVRATEVANALSIESVAAGIDRVLSMPALEIEAAMSDYAGNLTSIAIDRYAEFLEL